MYTEKETAQNRTASITKKALELQALKNEQVSHVKPSNVHVSCQILTSSALTHPSPSSTLLPQTRCNHSRRAADYSR